MTVRLGNTNFQSGGHVFYAMSAISGDCRYGRTSQGAR
jgi:hypothetical protein